MFLEVGLFVMVNSVVTVYPWSPQIVKTLKQDISWWPRIEAITVLYPHEVVEWS